MAHEELKKCSDCKHWQTDKAATPCMGCEDHSRWQPPFTPKYYSGLNWREALKDGLVGNTVRLSYDGENWSCKETLTDIKTKSDGPHIFGYRKSTEWAPFIRTTPETFKHPTIQITVNGKEYKLPRPEIDNLKEGVRYFTWGPDGINDYFWYGCSADYGWLEIGIIHLAKDRAQAWADFWQEAIVKAVQE